MPTPTNDWDIVLGLNQNLLSRLASSLYDSGRIPSSYSTETISYQIDLELSEPTVSFVNEANGDGSGETDGFTGDTQLLAVSVPVTGTMTPARGGPQPLGGDVIIMMNLAEMVVSAVGWPDYLQMGGVPGESAGCGSLPAFTGPAFTLEAWVKTTSKAFQTVMLFGNIGLSLSLENDVLRLDWGTEYCDSSDASAATVSDGKWHHIAVTVDDTGRAFFYKDGQCKSDFPKSGAPPPADALQLGAAASYPSPLGDAAAFDGDISQVRVWNYARTTVQIQQAMNTILAGNEDGLLGYWTFAGGAVENLADGSIGAVGGGTQIVNLKANEVAYSLNLYFLDPKNVFRASCNVSEDEDTNESFTKSIQSQLDAAVVAPADLGTVSPSADSKASALLPTYAATSFQEVEPGDPTDDQLSVMMMTQNRPQPAGKAGIDLLPGSDLLFAIWDYYLLDSLVVPALADKFGVDESAFSVSQNPAVLTLDKDVTVKDKDGKEVGTLTALTMQITEDGFDVECEVKAQPIIVPWVATFSGTIALSVEDGGGGTEELIFTLKNASLNIKADESDPELWGILAGLLVVSFIPVIGTLLVAVLLIVPMILVLVAEGRAIDALKRKLKGKDKTIDSDAFDLIGIVFNQGILTYLDYAPGGSAQEAPAASTLAAAPAPAAAGDAAGEVSAEYDAEPSPAPVISGFSPAAGDADTLVTISGTGFAGANSVKFNGTTAAYFRAKSDEEVLARPGAGATAGPISVTTPAGTAVSETSFNFLFPPVITGFSDADEVHLPGDAVTITGSNFTGAASVSFGNSKVAAAGFSVNSDGTQITAEIADGSVSGPVYVVAPGGQAASPQPILIGSTQVPTVLSFSPEAGVPQSSVTIYGESFAGATAVNFNDVPSVSFTLLSDKQIIAYVPDFPQLTTGPIAVKNNQGMSAPAGSFTVTPRPSNLSFEPASGGLGQTVTVRGSDLGGATSVTFGDNRMLADFEALTDSEITAVVPAGAVTGPVAVTTPSGTAPSEDAFTVLSSAPPADLSFTPATGGPGTSVTITGKNFTGTTLVTFNGALATPYTVQSDTEIVAFVPADATTGPIEVTNSTNPLTPTKSAQAFQFYPAPQIDAFKQSKGATGSPLNISGKNFTGTTSVTFGSNHIPAESFSVSASSDGKTDMINTTVPPGAVTGRVTVTTPGGTAVSEVSFNVVSSAAPANITFSPAGGGVGTEVAIQGKNFTGMTALTFFNGVEATAAQVESDTAITVRVPKGATTGRITVTNTINSASSAQDFSVESGPNNASD
jgi:hypothetical protein